VSKGSGSRAISACDGENEADSDEGGNTLSAPNDDELGGLKARSAPRDVRAADLQEKPTKRDESRVISDPSRFIGFDEDGGSRRTSQRAPASH
jgi:hypothetical protein